MLHPLTFYSSKKTDNTYDEIVDANSNYVGNRTVNNDTSKGNNDNFVSEDELSRNNALASIVIEKSSSSGSDTDNDSAAVSYTCNRITITSTVEKYIDIKKSLKAKIKLKRGWKGDGEIKSVFEVPRVYSLTAEEQRKKELRKYRNKQFATQSRLRQTAKEKWLEKVVKVLEDSNRTLLSEVTLQTHVKETLNKTLQSHLPKCPLGEGKKFDNHTEFVTAFIDRHQMQSFVWSDDPSITAAISKTNFENELLKCAENIPNTLTVDDAQRTDTDFKQCTPATLGNIEEPVLPTAVNICGNQVDFLHSGIVVSIPKTENINPLHILHKFLANDRRKCVSNMQNDFKKLSSKPIKRKVFHACACNDHVGNNYKQGDNYSASPTLHNEIDKVGEAEEKIIPQTLDVTITNDNELYSKSAKTISGTTRVLQHCGSDNPEYPIKISPEYATSKMLTHTHNSLHTNEHNDTKLNEECHSMWQQSTPKDINEHFSHQRESLHGVLADCSLVSKSAESGKIISYTTDELNQSLISENLMTSLMKVIDLMSAPTIVAQGEDLVSGLQTTMNEICMAEEQKINQIKDHLFDDYHINSFCSDSSIG